ncbi:MAG TPA: RNA methyltransferase [Acidobacteriota bacterium]|nr:RNA methyltransferase [Acidobacteriota bacterium]
MRSRVLDNCTIVLVEPLNAGNVGSAARAMKNMGLERLKLVRPVELDSECEKMAVGAIDIIERAAHYDHLDAALKEENVVIGATSSRGRTARRQIYTPRSIAPLVWDYARHQRVAIVFGPERGGLSQDQLARCQYLLTIPADPAAPTLNLAQSVLVVAYEIANFEGEIAAQQTQNLASHAEREMMFEHVQEVLLKVGFLDPNNPDHIMRSIRRFLGKADLTPRDVRILRGVMSQMDWYVRNKEADVRNRFSRNREKQQ